MVDERPREPPVDVDRVQIERDHTNRQMAGVDGGRMELHVGAARLRPAFRAPYWFVERWLDTIGVRGRRVLDYGCGAGTFAGMAPARGGSLWGVDISPDAVRVARDLCRRQGFEHLTGFAAADCERLPFADDTFDCVLSMGTLSCLDLPRAYGELARVVRPDGAVVIVDTLGHNPLLNLNRAAKRARGLKTQWHVDHVLKEPDFAVAERWFQSVTLHYFDLTTLSLAPLGDRAPAAAVSVCSSIDRRLLRGPLRRLAFKVVAVLRRH